MVMVHTVQQGGIRLVVAGGQVLGPPAMLPTPHVLISPAGPISGADTSLVVVALCIKILCHHCSVQSTLHCRQIVQVD